MRVKDSKVLYESITIIFDEDKVIKLFNNLEPDYKTGTMQGITLADCLDEAQKNGYIGGTITVLSESYLGGKIYRYNNYHKKEWCEIGNLQGFA